jgi:hypothetical protein
MRRGEVPFVAIRVGRSNDPREVLGLARELRIHRAHALGFLALWEELILEIGDAAGGRVRGYSAAHVAAKLGWEGPPARLIEALKRAGVLTQQRNVYVHPYWRDSPTGIYARMRSERREEWREKKAAQRAAGSVDVPGDVSGTNGGRPPHVPQKTHTDRPIEGLPGTPPPYPPAGGGGPGFARWEWLQKHHPRPRNSQACVRLLDVMPADSWELVQWVVGLMGKPLPRSIGRKKRVLTLDTHRFLATEAFLELLPERREKLARDKQPPAVANVEQPAEAVRLTESIAYVLAQLADHELSDDDKQKIRVRWMNMHPDTPAPWAAPS